jgi:periplasmic protein TonB
MKSHALPKQAATLEDIVFEGRNKAYGAYALNRDHRKYLLVSFLIALTGVSTAIAVPFIHARNQGFSGYLPERGITVILAGPEVEDPVVLPPPPPPPVTAGEEPMRYLPPLVVEEPSNAEATLMSMGELTEVTQNTLPPSPELVPVAAGKEIEEPAPAALWNPQESATFRNGDLIEFQKWVQTNVTYPQEAVDLGVFGKVVLQFCVNTDGQIEDVRIIRSADPLLDNESIRVVSASPRWKPARQGGRPVRQLFVIPVMFKLFN